MPTNVSPFFCCKSRVPISGLSNPFPSLPNSSVHIRLRSILSSGTCSNSTTNMAPRCGDKNTRSAIVPHQCKILALLPGKLREILPHFRKCSAGYKIFIQVVSVTRLVLNLELSVTEGVDNIFGCQ